MGIIYDLNKHYIRRLVNQLRPPSPPGATKYKPKDPERLERAKKIFADRELTNRGEASPTLPDRATAASSTYKPLYKDRR